MPKLDSLQSLWDLDYRCKSSLRQVVKDEQNFYSLNLNGPFKQPFDNFKVVSTYYQVKQIELCWIECHCSPAYEAFAKNQEPSRWHQHYWYGNLAKTGGELTLWQCVTTFSDSVRLFKDLLFTLILCQAYHDTAHCAQLIIELSHHWLLSLAHSSDDHHPLSLHPTLTAHPFPYHCLLLAVVNASYGLPRCA